MNLFKNILSAFILLTLTTSIILLLEYLLEQKKSPNVIEFKVLSEPINRNIDINKLFQLKFEYLIKSDICHGTKHLLAVIIVTSYAGNVETRSAMRRAFPQSQLDQFGIKRVFLLAVSPSTDKFALSQNALEDESRRFSDLVQGNFIEAYRNLTYKHMMGLTWAGTSCRNAQFVIKMDDDIIIDVYKVIKLLNSELRDVYSDNLLAGYVLRGMVPIRERANKWYVTKQEYSKSMYPPFLSGWFYVTTPQLALKFKDASSSVPYFWIDDVYVTGLLAKQLNVRQYSLNKLFSVHPEFLECCITDLEKYEYDCDFMVGPNGGDVNLFVRFNKYFAKCNDVQCKKRPESRQLNNTCVAERKAQSLGKGKSLIKNFKLF